LNTCKQINKADLHFGCDAYSTTMQIAKQTKSRL